MAIRWIMGGIEFAVLTTLTEGSKTTRPQHAQRRKHGASNNL